MNTNYGHNWKGWGYRNLGIEVKTFNNIFPIPSQTENDQWEDMIVVVVVFCNQVICHWWCVITDGIDTEFEANRRGGTWLVVAEIGGS